MTQVIISLFDKCVNEITLCSCETVPLTEIGPPHPPGGENRPIVANFQVSPAPLRQSLTCTKRGMYSLFSVYCTACTAMNSHSPRFFGFQSTPRCTRRRPHSLLSSELAPTPHPASASTATIEYHSSLAMNLSSLCVASKGFAYSLVANKVGVGEGGGGEPLSAKRRS